MSMLGTGVEPATALTGLGDVHAAQGNRAQAAEDYKQAIARSTDRRATADIERKLRNVERGQ
jgi:predicted negative regulator of RcsB-dependent stress response